MIKVSKEVGKYLKQIAPELCVKTSHNRHYFATECDQVWTAINQIRNEKVVLTYPEIKGRKGNYNEKRYGKVDKSYSTAPAG